MKTDRILLLPVAATQRVLLNITAPDGRQSVAQLSRRDAARLSQALLLAVCELAVNEPDEIAVDDLAPVRPSVHEAH